MTLQDLVSRIRLTRHVSNESVSVEGGLWLEASAKCDGPWRSEKLFEELARRVVADILHQIYEDQSVKLMEAANELRSCDYYSMENALRKFLALAQHQPPNGYQSRIACPQCGQDGFDPEKAFEHWKYESIRLHCPKCSTDFRCDRESVYKVTKI